MVADYALIAVVRYQDRERHRFRWPIEFDRDDDERLPDGQAMGDLPGCVDELKARIAALEGLLKECRDRVGIITVTLDPPGQWPPDTLRERIDAALKSRA